MPCFICDSADNLKKVNVKLNLGEVVEDSAIVDMCQECRDRIERLKKMKVD